MISECKGERDEGRRGEIESEEKGKIIMPLSNTEAKNERLGEKELIFM